MRNKHLFNLFFESDLEELVLREHIDSELGSLRAKWKDDRLTLRELEVELFDEGLRPNDHSKSYRLAIYSALPAEQAKQLAEKIESGLRWGYGLIHAYLVPVFKPTPEKPKSQDAESIAAVY